MALLASLTRSGESEAKVGAAPVATASASRRSLSREARAAWSAENRAWLASMAAGFQAKLEVSQPADPQEREADEVAELVMRSEAAPVTPLVLDGSASARVQRACSACSAEAKGPAEEDEVQRAADSSSTSTGVGPALGVALSAARKSGGEALPGATQTFMGSRFGQDFGGVRVHHDEQADQLAEAFGARAFTIGSDVFFREGQYSPGTDTGRRLLAHELTHVVQQGESAPRVSREPGGAMPSALAPGDVTRVKAPAGLQLGRDADLRIVAGAIVTNAPVQVLEVAEGGNKIKVARVVGGQAVAPVGWTLRAFLGEREASASPAGVSPAATSAGSPGAPLEGILAEFPVTFVAVEAPPGLGGATTGGGLALHVLASGDLSWLEAPAAARRVLSPDYWAPLVPQRGVVVLDRLVNELPRDLAPKIEAEFAAQASTGAKRLSWLQRGFSEAELRALPELVARLSRGEQLAATELALLQRAAAIHIAGASPGAPFASFMTPDHALTNVGSREFRVRVEVPTSSALDVSVPNDFNRGTFNLTNVEEAEWLVTTSKDGRITSVQRGGASESSFLMRHSGKLRWGGRVLLVGGLGISAHRIATAAPEERGTVIAEEAGGQLGGAAGASLAVAGCVFFGIATGGVGLFVCGLAGGIAGGVGGSLAGGALARSAKSSSNEAPCPSCHAQQREQAARVTPLDFSALDAIGKPKGGLTIDDVQLLERFLAQPSREVSPSDAEFMRNWLKSLPPR
jgi:hypothetical protein